MRPKYFIGPMSKNIVDSIIEFCEATNNNIALIPSRRQVENTGGYVNNWTTQEFTQYVKSKTDKILLVRDHAGPKQGQIDDDGYESLKEDCKHLDIIHIDPWKKHPQFSDGLTETIKMIEYCYNLNSNVQYEVGTEETIRRFNSYELSDLTHQLKSRLNPKVFNQIKYLVIQSGTSLKGTNQTGIYDSTRLKEMIEVCKQNNLISKEHNGDYIPVSTIKEKFDLGLESINIAPEFGLIETLTYIKEIENNWDFSLIDKFWKICFESKKWEKWVNQDFDPHTQKRDLIKICGHYVLSCPEFIENIESKISGIEIKIKRNINKKLKELYGY